MSNAKSLLEDARLLVDAGALPWIPPVQRSIAKHNCKHLVSIIHEWMPPLDWENLAVRYREQTGRHARWMAWNERRIGRISAGIRTGDPDDAEPTRGEIERPGDVSDALNIYRHIEIERLAKGWPWSDPEWLNGNAAKAAQGSVEKKKQAAWYVDISKTGQVGLHPGPISRSEADAAIKRAEALEVDTDIWSDEFKALVNVMKQLFADLNLRESENEAKDSGSCVD